MKSVNDAYPLKGQVALQPDMPLEEALADRGAVMAPILADRLGLKPGDAFRLGSSDFTLRATLLTEPDDAGDGFGLGLGLSVPAAVSRIDSAPMLRGIITRINDHPATEVVGNHWVIEGDRGVTYADAPDSRTRVTAGEWWPADYSGAPGSALPMKRPRKWACRWAIRSLSTFWAATSPQPSPRSAKSTFPPPGSALS